MPNQSLILAVDLYGCPNRCRHCWLGHAPNRPVNEEEDIRIVDYFRPFFPRITFYSWLREPDYCSHYRERWLRDNRISVGAKPERFELASFWRLVRNPDYVRFLKETDVKKVQLTFFGLELLTDRYIGRKGAFRELLGATEILLENGIAPRWQAFINEENKEEVAQLPGLAERLGLKERCAAAGEEFSFFVHSGSCDGENRRQYEIRITREHIPENLKPYYLNYNLLRTERECCGQLREDSSVFTYHNGDTIILNISNTFDVYFNFTHMTEEWKIGNLKTDHPAELVRRITEEDTWALNTAASVKLSRLAERYGNPQSERVFFPEDYKAYLLNCYLEEKWKEKHADYPRH